MKLNLSNMIKYAGFALLAGTAVFYAALSHSFAQSPSVQSFSDGALYIEASAQFNNTPYIMIQHEPFIISRYVRESDYLILRHTSVNVVGMTGESLVYTCGIRQYNKKISKRDCSGHHKIIPQNISSGSHIDSAVQLTSDLLPDSSGYSSSSISIEVSYI